MSYLYAGLGIAMLSGIFAMIQIGNNVDKFVKLISPANQDFKDYINSKSPEYDKSIMKIIYQDSGSLPDNGICEYVVNKINENIPASQTRFSTSSTDQNKFFNKICALETSDGKHRVIINQTNEKKYELFSCSLKEKNGNYCRFETRENQ